MVRLVPFHLGVYEDVLPVVTQRLVQVFGGEVVIKGPAFNPEEGLNKQRGQYNSRVILQQLLTEPTEGRLLAVTAVDLFIPVLSYVFGEAQLGGRAAVVSLHRLRREAYGLGPDAKLLKVRAVKEALHELGHTYGLVHCPNHDCVMKSSTYVEEIDLKPDRFCETCLLKVRAGGVSR